ncbi:MAG TPA: GNAT family N-acetyltransferase [Candidatus Methylomirabilis sp.]|nr:GNAT family N-acetyltransferase [Candidatus Methylomirabilis sp.]
MTQDVNSLTRLINVAFVVESFVFEGDRVDTAAVQAYMKSGQFLLAENEGGLAGCVYVELRGNRGYVGLLSVDPQQQGTGLGRKLMNAAENYFRAAGCEGVDLRIISQRTPLPSFYRHLGYSEAGTAPFAAGARPKVPGHYILMSKSLV